MRPPGPRGLGILTTILSFQRDPLQTLVDLTARYGDIVAYRFGPFPVVLLNHPEAVMRALQDNHPNFGKRHSPFYRMLRQFLGDGLVTSDGDFWLRQRRLAQPAFQRRRLEAMTPTMVACTEEMIQRWRGLTPGSRMDASQEMMQLTLRIAGEALFSQDLSRSAQQIAGALEELQVQMSQRFQSLLPLPPTLPTTRDRRFRHCRQILDEFALQIVQQRRAQKERPHDLLTALLEAKDPDTGAVMSDRQICDELITFLLAGHETTANTMAWALFLLSRHPDVRRRLEAEVDRQVTAGRSPQIEDLANMPLGERVINETMRLYPPVWAYGRRSYGPDQFRGYTIGANQLITVAPYVLHRHPAFWPNPEGFDPDRFLEERPKGVFVPFAAGPRQCIGNHFAMLEARLILATLVARVRVNLVSGARVEPDPAITLRPRGGLPVTLEFRQSPQAAGP